MDKKPLYRKVNKRTHNGIRHFCLESERFRTERHRKQKHYPERIAIKRKQSRHDNDYAPLYRFLLSRVGWPWDETFMECRQRLDKIDPVMDMVVNVNRRGVVVDKSIDFPDGHPKCFRDWRANDDSYTYWSALEVDSNGILQYVDSSFELSSADDCDELYGVYTASWNGKAIYPDKHLPKNSGKE